jgi:peptidoglycan/LPS O-acetylase OafA/YrhL
MISSSATAMSPAVQSPSNSRLDYLDATRAFALLLGIVFHASLSFVPIFMGWAVQDISTSPVVTLFTTVSHSFRMGTFFLLSGFLSRLAFHRHGAGDFVRSRLIRLGVPFVLGWFILRPLMVSGWIMGSASLRGHVDILAGLAGGFLSLPSLPNGLFTGSHLWFLYYLALITTLILGVRGLLEVSGPWHTAAVHRLDSWIGWLANSSISPAVLAVPIAVALGFMRFWGMDTPDQSLVPHAPALFVYGSFAALGWMLNRQPDFMAPITRLTWPRWIQAGLGITAILTVGGIERDPSNPHFLAARVIYALGYALTMWSLAFLMIGIFKRLAARPSAWVRYLADSSYWMYLIHLPIVVWLQVAVAELPMPWYLKLTLISGVTVGLSVESYDLFVRSTALGWLLNGRRKDRVLMPWLLGSIGLRGIGKTA